MENNCQRCHETIREADRYCPACGLPQLMYVPADLQVLAVNDRAGRGAMGAEYGAGQETGGIAWRPAFRAALMLAIPAGILCSGLTPVGQSLILGLIWMTGASAWAVSLYTRRARSARLSMGSGARIGVITGLLSAWLAVGVDGVTMWVGRYLLHQGGEMDSLWSKQVDQSMQISQQLVAQMGMASAESTQFAQAWRAMELSTEGHAAMMLSDLFAGAAFLVLFSALGGAFGARFLAQPRRPRA